MNTLEIVTSDRTVEVPRLDTPEGMIHGLETIVRSGINEFYDDVALTYYHGPAEALAVQQDPAYQRLLQHLEDRNIAPSEGASRKRTDIFPTSNDLIRVMAAKRGANSNGTTGGGTFGIEDTLQRRYIAAPAHGVPEYTFGDLDIDLEHGISFDGVSMLTAMFREGFEVETVRFRIGTPKVYREMQVGQFFTRHALA